VILSHIWIRSKCHSYLFVSSWFHDWQDLAILTGPRSIYYKSDIVLIRDVRCSRAIGPFRNPPRSDTGVGNHLPWTDCIARRVRCPSEILCSLYPPKIDYLQEIPYLHLPQQRSCALGKVARRVPHPFLGYDTLCNTPKGEVLQRCIRALADSFTPVSIPGWFLHSHAIPMP
jgi:hypothetical protein